MTLAPRQTPILQFRIPQVVQDTKVEFCSFAGEWVEGAGKAYTNPLLLQHRKHYTSEVFEIYPKELQVDTFLPFSWIAKPTSERLG
jgi:hypothetical protein